MSYYSSPQSRRPQRIFFAFFKTITICRSDAATSSCITWYGCPCHVSATWSAAVITCYRLTCHATTSQAVVFELFRGNDVCLINGTTVGSAQKLLFSVVRLSDGFPLFQSFISVSLWSSRSFFCAIWARVFLFSFSALPEKSPFYRLPSALIFFVDINLYRKALINRLKARFRLSWRRIS